jgi:hypothetical protein
MDGGEIVGFQGFVFKPILIDNEVVASFRSEFTIAAPRLRGTGIFPKFYKYSMEEIKRSHKEAYIWGETGHKGWINFGFGIIKRYSFYQIYCKEYGKKLPKPNIYNNRIINALCVFLCKCNPFRLLFRRSAVVYDKFTYLQFKAFESNTNNFRVRLFMDEEAFSWRYIENDFHKYLFVTYKDSLIIIRENESEVRLVDVYCKNVGEYMFLIAYLIRKYTTVIVHGNFYAMYKTAYFWVNMVAGFVPFFGGGSFVENNLNAKRICWKDISLLEAWEFGV